MPDGNHGPLKVAVLTRSGRCASARIAVDSLRSSGIPVLAVIGEPWRNLVFSKGLAAGLLSQVRRHGWRMVLKRALSQCRASQEETLAGFCAARGITYHEVPDHNGEECRDLLDGLSPDVLITANTRILASRILALPRVAGLNIHKSMLPRYAGIESIFWALYHGETEVGVTIHRLAEGLDTGDIMAQKSIPVAPEDTPDTLDHKADLEAGGLLALVVAGLQAGTARGVPQDRSQRTYFSWPTPAQRRELEERLSRKQSKGP